MKLAVFVIVLVLIAYIGFLGGTLLSGWLLHWLVPAVEFNTALIVASVALLCLVLGFLQSLLLVLFANIQYLRSFVSNFDYDMDEDDDWEDDEEDDEEDDYEEDDDDMDEYDSLDYEEIEFPEFDDDEVDRDEVEGTGRELPPLESRQSRRRRLRQKRRSKRRRRR